MALMERLGNTPPPPSLGRLIKWQRWWNKKRGRPATADVGIFASLLADLKSATAEALGNDSKQSTIHRIAWRCSSR